MPKQSGRQPGRSPASQTSVPTTSPSAQISVQFIPEEQSHPGTNLQSTHPGLLISHSSVPLTIVSPQKVHFEGKPSQTQPVST